MQQENNTGTATNVQYEISFSLHQSLKKASGQLC